MWNLIAQDSYTQTADELFQRFEFNQAIKEYLKLVEKPKYKSSSYVFEKLATSYYNIFDVENASLWYSKLIKTNPLTDGEIHYRYAQILNALNKYEEANKQMDIFVKKSPSDYRAKAHKSKIEYLKNYTDKPTDFKVKPITALNTKFSDFGGFLTADNTFYFVSAEKMNADKKRKGWNNQPYLDIYKAKFDGENFNASEPVKELNSKWHDGPLSITADGNTIYFISESFNQNLYKKEKNNNLKLGQLGLFIATKSDDSWDIKPFPLNSNKYSISSPAISKDGKTLYFSSDMPGTYGNFDIWEIEVTKNGFGTPKNLGKEVNTKGYEDYSYISDDNILYFASNQREGFGGLDIYAIDRTIKNATAKNLGATINSKRDDFSFTYNTKSKIGFFTSNIKGNDDLYMALPICKKQIQIIYKDSKTKKSIQNVNAEVSNSSTNAFVENNTKNKYFYEFLCEENYTVASSKEGYMPQTTALEAIENRSSNILEIFLEPIEKAPVITETEVILQPVYFEFNESNITYQGALELDKLVTVMNSHPSMNIFVKSHTDSKGRKKYNMTLSDKRAQATVQYIISKGIDENRISGKGFGESDLKVPCKKCTEAEHSQNRRSEFIIIKK